MHIKTAKKILIGRPPSGDPYIAATMSLTYSQWEKSKKYMINRSEICREAIQKEIERIEAEMEEEREKIVQERLAQIARANKSTKTPAQAAIQSGGQDNVGTGH